MADGPTRPTAPTAQPDSETVTRIVRASRAQVQGSAMERLFAARQRVRGAGAIPGLCGAVLHVGGWYVLWQEGPPAAIEAALRPSRRSALHEPPRLVHRSTGPRTLREALAISTTQWAEAPEQFERRIEALRQVAADVQPAEIWRALSEPCNLGPVGDVPRGHCWVGLLASDDQSSIEIARRLAERCRRPLVYRRFADGEPGSNDVGTAYFDVAFRGRKLRVQAVARRAFGHELVHHSLRTPDRVALLVGDKARHAMELATGVVEFLRRATGAPRVDLVAGDAGVRSSVGDFLRAHLPAGVTQREPVGDLELMNLLFGPMPEAGLA
ncbi:MULTISPECIES: hypothetical protein [Ramlibacter]|uniref:hypothetical protein n=1 Tax=Ramlibacter TaxID=174951 RepID=UPI0015EEDA51|nr:MULTISPECIES: hypothetical protein [Ramlibacter]MBA2964102.1 hypothetical protein [Ramlibacter sp. CGMCC 1.13660]